MKNGSDSPRAGGRTASCGCGVRSGGWGGQKQDLQQIINDSEGESMSGGMGKKERGDDSQSSFERNRGERTRKNVASERHKERLALDESGHRSTDDRSMPVGLPTPTPLLLIDHLKMHKIDAQRES